VCQELIVGGGGGGHHWQVYLGELLDAKRWSGVLGMGRVKVAEGLQADKEYLSEFFGKEEVLGQRLARAQTHLDRMQSVADLLQVDAADFVGMVHARFGEDARGRRGRKLALRVLAVRKDPERQQLEHAVNG
jgi:hypothetical protein